MNLSYWNKLKVMDKGQMIVTLLILAFGLTMIYSSTINATTAAEGRDAFRLQFVFLLFGLSAYLFFSFINYRFWQSWAWPIFGLSMGLLVLVLFIGGDATGTRRWLSFGAINIQPSEFAKLGMIMVASAALSARTRYAASWHYMLILGLILLPPALLVTMQPDLGTAVMFAGLWFSMVLAVGVKWRYILGIIGTIGISLPLLWGFLRPYQQQRVRVFLDPTSDPRGAGYNVIQAMIANGAGGVLGVGLGRGTQSQYKFLPVRHTDFIFSVIAEELGLIGTGVLILLFFILLWRILGAVQKASDNFGRYLCFCVFSMIALQTFINVGMNMGIMPVTGIPLPLVSYGGSSLIVTMAMLGLVQSVIIHSEKRISEKDKLISRVGPA